MVIQHWQLGELFQSQTWPALLLTKQVHIQERVLKMNQNDEPTWMVKKKWWNLRMQDLGLELMELIKKSIMNA